MSAAYLHLIINHFPVIGFILLLPLNIWGLISRSRSLKILAAAATIFISLSTVPVYFSGQEAEETLEDIVSIDEDIIHEHEEFAENALILSLASGFAGALALLSLLKKVGSKHFVKLQTLILLLNGSTAFVIGLTAQHGGHILHRDITGGHEHESTLSPIAEPNGEHEHNPGHSHDAHDEGDKSKE